MDCLASFYAYSLFHLNHSLSVSGISIFGLRHMIAAKVSIGNPPCLDQTKKTSEISCLISCLLKVRDEKNIVNAK